MFRIIQSSNSLPYSFIVDPNSEFEPGQFAQLGLNGNQVVCGVSDGTAPLGIIDDMKKNAFSSVSIDEVVIAPVQGVMSGGQLVAPYDVKMELKNPNIVANSFVSRPVSCELIPRNGVVVFLAGTPLNFSLTDSGTPDAIRTVVSYSYQIPNVPGDNTTFGSGRVTVWTSKLIGSTDQFEANQRYPLNSPLFISERGQLTTRQISADYPAVAMVTAPPTAIMTSLEFILF